MADIPQQIQEGLKQAAKAATVEVVKGLTGQASEDREFEELKQRKEAAARQRLAQLQAELKQVTEQKQAQAKAVVRQEEEKKVQEQTEESERQKRQREMITKAQQAVTGEVMAGKF